MFAWRSRLCCVPITCDEHNQNRPLLEPERKKKLSPSSDGMRWSLNLHFDAIIQDLLLGDELDDVIGHGEQPANLFLPPRLSVRGHGLQLPLLAKHRS